MSNQNIVIKFVAERNGQPTGELRRLSVPKAPTMTELLAQATSLFGNHQSLVIKYIDEDNDKVTVSSQQELDAALLFFRSSPTLRFIVELGVDQKQTSSSQTTPNQQTPTEPTLPQHPNPQQFLRTLVDSLAPLLRNIEVDIVEDEEPSKPNSQQQQQSAPSNPSSSSTSAVHEHVICDGCGINPIRGIRFKCCMCPDFDFCEKCHSSNKSSNGHDPTHPFIEIAQPVHPRFAARMCRRYMNHCCPPPHHIPPQFGRPMHPPHMPPPPPLPPFGGMFGGPRRPPFGGMFGGRGCGWGQFNPFVEMMMNMKTQQQMAANQSGLNAQFIEDVTLEDGTVVDCNTTHTKIWKMKNSGTIAWPQGTVLKFIAGDSMGSLSSVPISSIVTPGSIVDVVIEVIALEPRRHYGVWILCTPDGIQFGPRIWIDVTAIQKEQPKSTTTEPSAPSIPTPVVSIPITVPSAPQPVVQQTPEPEKTPIIPQQEQQQEQPKQQQQEFVVPKEEKLQATKNEKKIMETLRAMGFNDDSLNLGLIRMHKGNLEAVLYHILGSN